MTQDTKSRLEAYKSKNPNAKLIEFTLNLSSEGVDGAEDDGLGTEQEFIFRRPSQSEYYECINKLPRPDLFNVPQAIQKILEACILSPMPLDLNKLLSENPEHLLPIWNQFGKKK